jgi:hypothetical protein
MKKSNQTQKVEKEEKTKKEFQAMDIEQQTSEEI